MKWIKDEDGDYINLDRMDVIHVRDYGNDYTNPFVILAESKHEQFTIGQYSTESNARLKLDKLMKILEVRNG